MRDDNDNIVYLDAHHRRPPHPRRARPRTPRIGLDVAKGAAQLLADGHSVRTVSGALLIAAVVTSKRENSDLAIAGWLRGMADTVEQAESGPAIVGRA